MPATLISNFLQPKFGKLLILLGRQSARFPTKKIIWLISARRGVHVGSVFARPFAVRRKIRLTIRTAEAKAGKVAVCDLPRLVGANTLAKVKNPALRKSIQMCLLFPAEGWVRVKRPRVKRVKNFHNTI